MKLSTKGRYGVRAMLDLALSYGSGPVPLRTIAERQGISEHYLEQLIAVLRKSGLVKSVRGAYGGYLLSRPPKDITIGDIIRSLEGPVAPTECVGNENGFFCENIEDCVTRVVWQKLKDKINEVLDEMNLDDLCKYALKKKHGETEGFMYHI